MTIEKIPGPEKPSTIGEKKSVNNNNHYLIDIILCIIKI